MNAPANWIHPLALTVLRFHEEPDDYQFHVEAPDPDVCEKCGTVGELVRFGKADQAYRDLPVHGKRVTLWLVRRRFRCKSCGCTFRPTIKDMDEGHFMTKRLVAYVEKAVLKRSNTEVAAETGIEEKTVREIFNAYRVANSDKLKFVTPRILGIDEIYISKKVGYWCVLTNIEKQTVIDLLPNRSLALVIETMKGFQEPKNVEIITMDMYHNYRRAARKALPNAKAVVDKFHLVRMANDTLEKVRKSFRKTLTKEERIELKNDRKLLLMRRHTLTLLQQQTAKMWMERFPLLSEAYDTKERFFEIYDAKDLQQAKDALAEWRRLIPAEQVKNWGPLSRTVGRWEAHIFTYFSLPDKVTNAFTESANRKMKDLHRSARGMSFATFRAKVLFGAQHKVERKRVPKASPFEPDTTFGDAMSMGRMTPSPGRVSYEDIVLDYGVPISTMLGILESEDI